MKTKERVQICPQCGSPDIETDFSNPAAVEVGFFNVMKCNHCSHEGTFFPTIEKSDLKKPISLKKVKNVQHFDTTFAKSYFKMYFWIMAIFFGIAGIVMLAYLKDKDLPIYPIIGSLTISLICLIILIIAPSKKKL